MWQFPYTTIFFRMIHGFSSAGLLHSQYEGFCNAANIGMACQPYITEGMHLIKKVFIQGINIQHYQYSKNSIL